MSHGGAVAGQCPTVAWGIGPMYTTRDGFGWGGNGQTFQPGTESFPRSIPGRTDGREPHCNILASL